MAGVFKRLAKYTDKLKELKKQGYSDKEAKKLAQAYFDKLPKDSLLDSAINVATRTAEKVSAVSDFAAKAGVPGASLVSLGSGVFSSGTGAGNPVPAFVDQVGELKVPFASSGSGVFASLLNPSIEAKDRLSQVLPSVGAQFLPGSPEVVIGDGGIVVKIPNGDNSEPVNNKPAGNKDNGGGSFLIWGIVIVFLGIVSGVFKKLLK